jgi:hypothetical protein
MPFLIHRFHRTVPPSVPQRCPIVSLPAELRLQIYLSIAPDSFLPYVHHKDYMGLFLSCKLINREMSHEALRAAPKVLQDTQNEHDMQDIIRLQPLHSKDFTSLMNLTLSIPRWSLFSSQVQEEICAAMAPVLALHLSTLTIGLEDMRDEIDLVNCYSDLHTYEFLDFRAAHHWVLDGPGSQIPDREKYYDVCTTYTDVVKFAIRMNCHVTPNICTSGEHDEGNYWCLQSPGSTFQLTVANQTQSPNIRRIVFLLKTLHNEETCEHCGELPQDIYPSNRERSRWHPEHEMRQLRDLGWTIRWADEKGKWPWVAAKKPTMFEWKKIEERKGCVLKGIKEWLKHK